MQSRPEKLSYVWKNTLFKGERVCAALPNLQSSSSNDSFKLLCLPNHRFQPEPIDVLQRAFRVLDANDCGELSEEELTKLFTTNGEPFRPEEMEEFLHAALDPKTKKISYKRFVHFLVVDDEF